MLSSKDKSNLVYINREKINNFVDLSLCLMGLILLVLTLIVSCIQGYIILIVYTVTFSVFMSCRVLTKLHLIFAFRKLVNKIAPEQIEIYVTRSWLRKKEGSIWVGIIFMFTLILVFITIGIALGVGSDLNPLIYFLIPSVHFIIIIIYMILNYQTLDSNLKISEKRININSIDWIQTKKDYSLYYKQMTVWYIHILFVVPLLLMLSPKYRSIWNKL